MFIFCSYLVLGVGKLVIGKNRVFAGCNAGVRTLARLADIPAAYTHPSEKQCSYSYTHPTTKQCNYSYTYTHPSTIQCNASSEISSLKSSVSNGKSLIASAITDKGVSTSASATFQTMSDNIRVISTKTAVETAALSAAYLISSGIYLKSGLSVLEYYCPTYYSLINGSWLPIQFISSAVFDVSYINIPYCHSRYDIGSNSVFYYTPSGLNVAFTYNENASNPTGGIVIQSNPAVIRINENTLRFYIDITPNYNRSQNPTTWSSSGAQDSHTERCYITISGNISAPIGIASTISIPL